MKARYGLALGLTVALLGCGVSDTSSTSTDASSTLSSDELAEMTLVRLKVPNMT